MQKREYIGINFGTTNTAVVHFLNEEHGTKITHLGDEEGSYPFSSIVALPFGGGPIKFGREVRNRRAELAEDHEIISSMKSYLGTNKEFFVGNNCYSATDITTEYLKSVKSFIKEQHGVDITEAGLAFPIDFSSNARRELLRAAENAGINVTRFVSESTAAFFSCKNEQNFRNVMVLDWGGGTFDISILNVSESSACEIAVYGEDIGGDDIDLEFAKHVHLEIVNSSDFNSRTTIEDMKPKERDLLIARCERAKIDISDSDEDHDFTIVNYGEFGDKCLTISAYVLDSIVEQIVNKKILRAIDIALGKAKLTAEAIDSVLIIGGCSNLSVYETMVTSYFGTSKIILPRNPAWATAEGVAYMQVTKCGMMLSDTLGVMLCDKSILPIFEAKSDGVGSSFGPVNFSLVEDSQYASFIFANKNSYVYDRVLVPTKGFLNEEIQLRAEIGVDQIARIRIASTFMRNDITNPPKNVEISNLTFYYDFIREAEKAYE